ncbi:MAG: hypothetical protein IJZ68_06615 [Bacteroidaceae bacterium]|nr:hypothetical protein [Bacteroidaceae bacterium]
MYFSDTKRCPYCRGDMLTVEHMESGSRVNDCAACGTHEEWRYNENKAHYTHILQRPTAYVSLLFPHGLQDFAYYGKHPYKWLKNWKRNVKFMHGVIMSESFGVVYNKKHKKLIAVFGKPVIYPDEYYADDSEFI